MQFNHFRFIIFKCQINHKNMSKNKIQAKKLSKMLVKNCLNV